MTIGIIALRSLDNSKDLPRFLKAAKKLKINIKFYQPSDLIIRIYKREIIVFDRQSNILKLDGIINWIPFSNNAELSFAFKYNKIPFINNNKVVRRCRNKALTNVHLAKKGILQPYTEYYPKLGEEKRIDLGMPFPLIYKNKSGTHGIDAEKFNNAKMFSRFLDDKNSKGSLYLQEFIDNHALHQYRQNAHQELLLFLRIYALAPYLF